MLGYLTLCVLTEMDVGGVICSRPLPNLIHYERDKTIVGSMARITKGTRL